MESQGLSLRRIAYFWGMFRSVRKIDRLKASKVVVFLEPDIPQEVLDSLMTEGVLELSGDFGDPDAGEPIEVDSLEVEVGRYTRRVRVFNRGITLLTTDDPEVRRLHRFFGALEKAVEP